MKTNLKKAYDRLEGASSIKPLLLGLQKLIHNCVSIINYALLLNVGVCGNLNIAV